MTDAFFGFCERTKELLQLWFLSQDINGWLERRYARREQDVRFMQGLEKALSIKLINTGTSHHTANDEPWIDFLHVDVNHTVRDVSRTQPTFRSRHDIFSFTIDLFKPVPPSSSYTFRSYNMMSPDEINMHLEECDWSVLPPSPCIWSWYLRGAPNANEQPIGSNRFVSPRENCPPNKKEGTIIEH